MHTAGLYCSSVFLPPTNIFVKLFKFLTSPSRMLQGGFNKLLEYSEFESELQRGFKITQRACSRIQNAYFSLEHLDSTKIGRSLESPLWALAENHRRFQVTS